MDIRCPRCGEPWDLDSLHDVAQEQGVLFNIIRSKFMSMGCEALSSEAFGPVAQCERDRHAETRAMLAELSGDDVDGYCSDMEDFEELFG